MMITDIESELFRMAAQEEAAQKRMLEIEQETRSIKAKGDPIDLARIPALVVEMQQCRMSDLEARTKGWALVRVQEQLRQVHMELGTLVVSPGAAPRV